MKRLLLLFALLALVFGNSAAQEAESTYYPQTSRWSNIPDPQYSNHWDYRPDGAAYGDDIVPLYFRAGVYLAAISGNPYPESESYFATEPAGTAVGPQDKKARRRVVGLQFRRATGHAWDQCSDRAQCTGAFDELESMVGWYAPFDLKRLRGFRIGWRIAGTSWDKQNSVVYQTGKEGLVNRRDMGGTTRQYDYFPLSWVDNPSYGYKSLPTIQPGQSLQIRVRALYKGSKKGPWSDTLTIPHPAQGCGDENYEMVVSNLTACWKRY